MNNEYFSEIIKKKLQKSIVDVLCKNNVINIYQYNSIIKKLDDDITKIENKYQDKESMEQIVIDILL